MAISVISVPNGVAVSAAAAPFGYPVTVSTNGFGLGVTPVASGGRPVFDTSGTLFGPPVIPTNITPPLILGTPQVGLNLVSTNGTWGGTLATYTYQWLQAATGYATLDPATISNVTLSGSNLVATNTGTTSANQGAHVVSTSGKTSGKYYFEATWTTISGGANTGIGVGTTASTYTNMGNGGTTGVHAFRTGTIWSNGSNILTLSGGSWAIGTTIKVAVDLDNRKIWFASSPSGIWNNSGSNDPVTNVGGLTIPAGTMVPFVTFGGTGGAATGVLTANFGASAFTGAVPSGFTSGWPISVLSPIPGATNSLYTLVTTDLGTMITVTVTATNGAGSASATSAAVGPVLTGVPANTVPPVIGGTPTIGQTLTVTSNGTWTGAPTLVYTYQWSQGVSIISGATSSTYTLTPTDVGEMINCFVRATNSFGNTLAASNSLGPVAATGAGPTPPVMAMDPGWISADTTPDFVITVDNTVVAGDSMRLQIQAASGGWTSPVDDVLHLITSGEDSANLVTLATGALGNGNYEARTFVIDAVTGASLPSNVVSFTITGGASATSTFYILGF